MIFKAKIWKTGNSYVMTIPKDFVDNNLLKNDQEYEVQIIQEIKE